MEKYATDFEYSLLGLKPKMSDLESMNDNFALGIIKNRANLERYVIMTLIFWQK